MLHLVLLILFGLALILIEGSFSSLAVKPNLPLIIAVYAGQFYSPMAGLIISFILGYFLDLTSGSLMGLNTFSLVSLSYLSSLLGDRMVIQNRLTQAVVIFISCMAYSGIIYLLFSFFNIAVSGYAYIKISLWDGFVTAIISPVLISVIKKMERLLRFENERTAGAGDIEV